MTDKEIVSRKTPGHPLGWPFIIVYLKKFQPSRLQLERIIFKLYNGGYMIHIKYKLDTSQFHGIGLFASQDVKEGELIYSASPTLDVNLSQNQFDALTDGEKAEVKYWGFWVEADQVWHVDFDNSKFINHSRVGNVTQDSTHPDAWLVATRNIKAGEELTQNYLEFETEDDLKRRGISD